jgi:hypothetical protein
MAWSASARFTRRDQTKVADERVERNNDTPS